MQGMALVVEYVAAFLGERRTQLKEKFKEL